jgi:hypothetical protein
MAASTAKLQRRVTTGALQSSGAAARAISGGGAAAGGLAFQFLNEYAASGAGNLNGGVDMLGDCSFHCGGVVGWRATADGQFQLGDRHGVGTGGQVTEDLEAERVGGQWGWGAFPTFRSARPARVAVGEAAVARTMGVHVGIIAALT